MRVAFNVRHDEARNEWVLSASHPNGSYAGLGALNGKVEAELVLKSLRVACVEDSVIRDKWLDYFTKDPTP